MTALSSLGIGLNFVSGCLILALIAVLYHLLWWKKRVANTEKEEKYKSKARQLLYFLCWKKPSSLSSAALNPQEICSSVDLTNGSDDAHLHSSSHSSLCKDFLLPFGAEEESVDAELMRIHSLSGPPRFLFTIKEETNEDLESENGRSRNGSRGGNLSDLFLTTKTPFLTPLSSPPSFTPPSTTFDCYSYRGLNPHSEYLKNVDLSDRIRSSPPPEFKFLKDAEEKLYKRTLMEEALKARRSYLVQNVAKMESSSVLPHSPVASSGIDAFPSSNENDGSLITIVDGSLITIVVGKNIEKGHQHFHHTSFSPVNPLSSPPII